ncbi:hypothetical protein [Clostridium sp.]|uniref:hypothetical protein n=1 Tax=Clostridium sp. TaxID=1506 RepID=UPI003D6C71C9
MKSFVIWYEGKKDNISLDIHINLWRAEIKSNGKSEYFLDLGLMIEQVSDLKTINIVFPFKFKRDDFCDLGKVLISDRKIVNAIFNNECNKIDLSEPKKVLVQNGAEKFHIYSLEDEFNERIVITENKSVSLLAINMDIQDEINSCYIRFRVQGEGVNSMVEEHKLKFTSFQSAFKITECIDFRLNEKRSISDDILEKINKANEFTIKKVHFLLLIDIDNKLECTGLKYSSRKLEDDIWNNYITEKYKSENLIAYHWKEKAEVNKKIESFNSLIRIKIDKCNWVTIFCYVMVVFILNITSNFLFQGLKNILNL